MEDDFDKILEEWKTRVNKKTSEIENNFDRGLLKASLYCEGKAKENAMNVIYMTNVPFNDYGEDMWSRTGLLKAAIGSGMDPIKSHSALVFCTAAYAKYIEYGTGIYAVNGDGRKTPWIFETNTGVRVWTRGMRAKPFMGPSVFQNKEDIKTIIVKYLKEACNDR